MPFGGSFSYLRIVLFKLKVRIIRYASQWDHTILRKINHKLNYCFISTLIIIVFYKYKLFYICHSKKVKIYY